jgi:hypothetical protein
VEIGMVIKLVETASTREGEAREKGVSKSQISDPGAFQLRRKICAGPREREPKERKAVCGAARMIPRWRKRDRGVTKAMG